MKSYSEIRWSILSFIRERVLKIPEGQVAPKILRVFYWILFPLNNFYSNQSGIHYDPCRSTYTVRGLKFSSWVIDVLKTTDKSSKWKILKVEDGVMSVERIDND